MNLPNNRPLDIPAILEASGESIATMDSDGRLLSCNRSFSTLTGWSGDEPQNINIALLFS
jgi:PAS domain S-box-containing protein